MHEPAHILRIMAIDQPGTIEIISAAFSSRGLALDALFAPGKGSADSIEQGISLVYRASPRRHALMVRILHRMACVRSVEELDAATNFNAANQPASAERKA